MTEDLSKNMREDVRSRLRRRMTAMWDWIKDAAGAIWDGITGFFSSIVGLLQWLVQRGLGVVEFISSYFGFMPKKRLRVQVVILPGEDGAPIASREDVREVLNLARDVFKKEANVAIQSTTGQDNLIISVEPPPVPEDVLTPKCDGGGWLQVFSNEGRWFRAHSARHPAGTAFGYGSPATIFIVEDVQGKRGCWPWPFSNYGYIDPAYLNQSAEGAQLGLAHELGHACDLLHNDNRSLMEPGYERRRSHLSRFQRAWLRSSPRVTYL